MALVKRLGEALVNKNLITKDQLDEALREEESTGNFWGEILVKKGHVSEKVIVQNLSEQLGLAYVDLENFTLDPDVVQLLPQEIATKCLALPLIKRSQTVTVAMADPMDAYAIEQVEKALGMKVRPVLATSSHILQLIEGNYGKPLSDDQPKLNTYIDERQSPRESEANADSVIQTVDDIISKAVDMKASDIHLEPQTERYCCRYRIDGILHDMQPLPKASEAAITSRIKIMANMDIAEKRLPQDGRIKTQIVGKDVDLRISSFPTLHGENMVIRILDKSRALIPLDDLGMAPAMLRDFSRVIEAPHGIILVTGPTGSGKTTTLYSALTKINTIGKNVITLEDPIEYEIDRVAQSQINVKAGLTFALGLRSIVRQDPDIIMIGEIRDYETAEIAIHAALTGHLVFSTLHTNDAASAAARLIDMGVEPFLVSSALIGIVAQRLVRILCPRCKEGYVPTPETLQSLNIKQDKDYRLFRQKGCAYCRNTGYSGRLGLYELLLPDEHIRSLIEKKSQAHEIREAAVARGMKTIRQDGIDKMLLGITSLSEVLRVT